MWHPIRHLPRTTLLLAVAALLHGCSDSTAPRDEDLLGLDDVLGEAMNADIDALGTVLAPSGPVAFMSAPTRPTSAGCGYQASSQSFVCPTQSRDGLTYERSFILFDAAGSRQSEFRRGVTASVRTISRLGGTVADPLFTQTIDIADDRTVSGLLGTRHVLDGTSSVTMQGTLAEQAGGPPIPMRMTSTSTIESLVLPSKDRQWPGPGTIRMAGTMTFGAEPASSYSMRVIFDGTKCVTITWVMDGSTQTMTTDLSNPSASTCRP